MKNHCYPVLISLLLSACAYVPVSKPPLDQDESCQMFTKELKLKEEKILNGGACSGAACAAFAIVPATTFLVSGSIVLIGNTLHWLEKTGTCSHGLIGRNLKSFTDWASTEGGQSISQP